MINMLMKKKKISLYNLAKTSDIPYTTLRDICTGKTKLEKCKAETVFKIARGLDVSVEALLFDSLEERCDFDVFKSNVCHKLKTDGDKNFIISLLKKDDIRRYYSKKWYPESLYLLGMLDYLCRENNIPYCTDYNDLRKSKLKEILYPSGIKALCIIQKNENPKKKALKEAIPEFYRFNIVESEVRDIV